MQHERLVVRTHRAFLPTRWINRLHCAAARSAAFGLALAALSVALLAGAVVTPADAAAVSHHRALTSDLAGARAREGAARVSSAFAAWAQAPGVKALSGDFNGDGNADIALVGGSGWYTIPIAFSRGDGSFDVTNAAVPDLPGWAQGSGVKAVVGDFNADGRADIALVGGSGWYTVPVGFSRGDGSFDVTNVAVRDLPGWAQGSGVKAVAGDFNADGRADIALVGGSGWYTVPVGFSRGYGGFDVTNAAARDLAGWAQGSGVKAVVGDFNADGRADIALVGGSGWYTVPVGFSRGDGSFDVTNVAVRDLPGWAQGSGVKAVAGDFNADGRADIALVGGSGWYTVPVGFSRGYGGFDVTNAAARDLAGWAQGSGVKAVAGDFNGDGRADIALVGGSGWYTVPVGFSRSDGSFDVTNTPVP